MNKILYLEKAGLRVEPRYEGNDPVEHLVVDVKTGETVDRFETLHDAEEFIMVKAVRGQ